MPLTARSDYWCGSCRTLAVCGKCRNVGAFAWHRESGECRALASLRHACARVFGTRRRTNDDATTERNGEEDVNPVRSDDDDDDASQLDTLHLLAVRLMFRRWYDNERTKAKTEHQTKDVQPRTKKPKIVSSKIPELFPAVRDPAVVCPLPPADWDLFESLYMANVTRDATAEEKDNYQRAVRSICEFVNRDLVNNRDDGNRATQNEQPACDTERKPPNHALRTEPHSTTNDVHYQYPAPPPLLPMSSSWMNESDYHDMVGRIVGCGHAVTDLTLRLGAQCVGRAVFPEHSFYNHACAPTSFLSCRVVNQDEDDATTAKNAHVPALTARLYSLVEDDYDDVKEASSSVTISYIPTSGLSRAERQKLLKNGYDFDCDCDVCNRERNNNEVAVKSDSVFSSDENNDADLLRQVQYACHETLHRLEEARRRVEGSSDDDDDLARCDANVRMVRRGVANQGLPPDHEVSLENHRLAARVRSLSGNHVKAVAEHEAFLSSAEPLARARLFDPVALAAQRIALAEDLERWSCSTDGEDGAAIRDRARSSRDFAVRTATTALGADHPYVRSLEGAKQATNVGRGAVQPVC